MMLAFLSCEKETEIADYPDKTTFESAQNHIPRCPPHCIPVTDSCLTSRSTTGTLNQVQGNILYKGNDMWTIAISKTDHIYPCFLPSTLKVNGLAIEISGNIKEIYPYERWPGTPFQLHCYKILTAEN